MSLALLLYVCFVLFFNGVRALTTWLWFYNSMPKSFKLSFLIRKKAPHEVVIGVVVPHSLLCLFPSGTDDVICAFTTSGVLHKLNKQ